MANPFSKAWRYLMALFNSKIDEHADPKVQIQQAIEEAQRQHQALTQQAAQVIGNQRQLEQLAALMHSGQSGDYRGMPPGGIAVLTLPVDVNIEPGIATLSAFWWP